MSGVEQLNQFKELFEFLGSDRLDVKKAAIQGLASISKDNSELQSFVASDSNAAQALIGLLRIEDADTLAGDTMAVLINCSVHPAVAESLNARGIVAKLMRFIEALKQLAAKMKNATALREMALMLLNNMTSRSPRAVDALLLVDDPSLKGFHIEQLLQMLKDSLTPMVATWCLHIMLNCTQCHAGQELIVNDDEVMGEVAKLLETEAKPGTSAAVKLVRNCCCNQQCHPKLLERSIGKVVLRRLCEGIERDAENQKYMIEAIAGLMASEGGMKFMEEINARKLMMASRDKLDVASQKLLDEAVIPFLEDVVDVWVNQPSQE